MGYNYKLKLKAPFISAFTAFLTQFFRNAGYKKDTLKKGPSSHLIG
jgi:hypothetical protein